MWRFGFRRVGRFVLGLFVAVVLAASISSLAVNNSGLADSYTQSFVQRVVGIAHFDFGTSSISTLPAWTDVSKRLPPTFELVCLGGLIALVIGTIVGALFGDRRARRISQPLLQIVSAVPLFCLAIGLIWLSQRFFHWAGSGHSASLVAALEKGDVGATGTALRAVALPALTVGLAGAYSVQRLLRRAVSNATAAPYRRGLRALGLGRFEVDRLYVLPQILAAFVSGLGEFVSSLLAATAIAERVFDWPGVADLFFKSVALRDWTVVALVLFVFAALTMTFDLLGAMLARFLAATEAAP